MSKAIARCNPTNPIKTHNQTSNLLKLTENRLYFGITIVYKRCYSVLKKATKWLARKGESSILLFNL